MSYILDIATVVPEYSATTDELVRFYSKALKTGDIARDMKKISFLANRTKINKRHSCIPDFNGYQQELFIQEEYEQPVEKRMSVYKEKIVPLSVNAINLLLLKNHIDPCEITHLITVSCTGVYAPGLEFFVAEACNLQHTEKSALNFLGCYAAIKALKYAHYITESSPEAAVLIVCAELCTLHFHASNSDDDILSNLLFADGAAAALIAGKESTLIKGKKVLQIDSIGSAYVPNTLDLMTWNVTASAFRMFLSKKIVPAIEDNIKTVVDKFTENNTGNIDYWAIHPGGVKIVEAVRNSLGLTDEKTEDSMSVLEEYGNMSSPTILFILKRIFDKMNKNDESMDKNIFTCAFGPGLSIEMILLSLVSVSNRNAHQQNSTHYAIKA